MNNTKKINGHGNAPAALTQTKKEPVSAEVDVLKLEITRLMKTASVSDLWFVLSYLKA